VAYKAQKRQKGQVEKSNIFQKLAWKIKKKSRENIETGLIYISAHSWSKKSAYHEKKSEPGQSRVPREETVLGNLFY